MQAAARGPLRVLHAAGSVMLLHKQRCVLSRKWRLLAGGSKRSSRHHRWPRATRKDNTMCSDESNSLGQGLSWVLGSTQHYESTQLSFKFYFQEYTWYSWLIFLKSCNFYNMKSHCNIETLHNLVPPALWRFTGLQRQNSGHQGWFFWGVGGGGSGGGRYTGERKWILSSCPAVWPARNPGLAHVPG